MGPSLRFRTEEEYAHGYDETKASRSRSGDISKSAEQSKDNTLPEKDSSEVMIGYTKWPSSNDRYACAYCSAGFLRFDDLKTHHSVHKDLHSTVGKPSESADHLVKHPDGVDQEHKHEERGHEIGTRDDNTDPNKGLLDIRGEPAFDRKFAAESPVPSGEIQSLSTRSPLFSGSLSFTSLQVSRPHHVLPSSNPNNKPIGSLKGQTIQIPESLQSQAQAEGPSQGDRQRFPGLLRTEIEGGNATVSAMKLARADCHHSFKVIKFDDVGVIWNCNICHSGPHSLIYSCSNCNLRSCRPCASKA